MVLGRRGWFLPCVGDPSLTPLALLDVRATLPDLRNRHGCIHRRHGGGNQQVRAAVRSDDDRLAAHIENRPGSAFRRHMSRKLGNPG